MCNLANEKDYYVKRLLWTYGHLHVSPLTTRTYITESVIISGDNIEIQFNLNIGSRVVTYPADIITIKEIPQPTDQSITEVLTFVPTKMLATHGTGGRTRTDMSRGHRILSAARLPFHHTGTLTGIIV